LTRSGHKNTTATPQPDGLLSVGGTKEIIMAKIGVVFGGRSVEHQVSIRSARTVAEGLEEAGHEVVPLGIAPDGGWVDLLVGADALGGGMDALPATGKPPGETLERMLGSGAQVMFPIVHGTWGEDGTLQGLFEMLDIPYVGPGVAPSAIAMDKITCKRQLEAEGLAVVEYETTDRLEFETNPKAVVERLARFKPPIFVKPSVGGSSVGITKVDDPNQLQAAVAHALRFDERVLVERGVPGRELECAVLGYGEIEASVIGEIIAGKDFYDYADKYLDDGAQLLAPADLPETVAEMLQETAVRAFGAIGGWGMSRIDFLLEGTKPWINEINTLPGFTSISMYPVLWRHSGLPLPHLVDRLVNIAFDRHRDRRRLDEGIKSWITGLTSH
jgi:D-alanine-D-alanine ligase